MGAALAVACALATPTNAARVLSLGSGRGYDHPTKFALVMTESSMDVVRTALEGDGHTFHAGESFVAAGLVGYDIVFLGLMDSSESLTAQERAALRSFVTSGGALICLGDNDFFSQSNTSLGDLFGVTFSSDPHALRASDLALPTHPIIRGPAGTVRTYDGSLNLPGFFGGISGLGANARAVLRSDERTLVAVIERGRLAPGSGPVVYAAETSGFADATLGTINLGDNLVLMRNIFAFAAGIDLPCQTNDACDDALFCNGAEVCVDGDCRRGTFPCTGGDGCHENTHSCEPCTDNQQCDDMLFCDGVETCVAGRCQSGARPCSSIDGCQEDLRSCSPCRADSDCDDNLFCTGIERCTGGLCSSSNAPCGEACESCNEDTQSCSGCLLDLDHDGFIGTGDFASLAGCFGACYAANHPCQASNFDGSADGCVGTGDFAAFSGCFGGACQQCSNCERPADINDLNSVFGETDQAHIALTTSSAYGKNDFAHKLTSSITSFQAGQSFFVDVWATRSSGNAGLASVYADLNFDPRTVAVLDVYPSQAFSTFADPTVDSTSGIVRKLGGCTEPGVMSAGVDPTWVRIATLRIRALRDETIVLTTKSVDATFGVSIAGAFGNVDPQRVEFGELTLIPVTLGTIGEAPTPTMHPGTPR